MENIIYLTESQVVESPIPTFMLDAVRQKLNRNSPDNFNEALEAFFQISLFVYHNKGLSLKVAYTLTDEYFRTN